MFRLYSKLIIMFITQTSSTCVSDNIRIIKDLETYTVFLLHSDDTCTQIA